MNRRGWAVVLAAIVVVSAVAGVLLAGEDEPAGPQPGIGADAKRACGYGQNRISGLERFGAVAGRRFDCAVVFTDPPGWEEWERPYFLEPNEPDIDWARWVRAGRGRRDLVVTQSLIPSELRGSDWARRAAAGEFDGHARAFARNLVRAGLGHAVIRLAHEANFTRYAHSLPDDAAGQREWGRAWRREVLAMKSVPGARFRFDLTVNAAVRPIPIERFWPGDDVVDIVGIDAYDAGIPPEPRVDRWRRVYQRPLGLRDVARFAAAHDKDLSIPEWGVGPAADPALLSGGDDPAYVDGIARVVRRQRVAYQSYFFNHEWAFQLPRSPRSLAAYRRHFGAGGDSVGPD